MSPRIAFTQMPQAPYKALLALEEYLRQSSVQQPLLHLVKLRASQINGCAYCIDMHWKDLRALGEPEQRLYALDAWRESPFYSEQERAALAWTESVTNVAQTHADDATYELVKQHFSEKQIVELTFVIATINAWNRLSIATRAQPGGYQSKLKAKGAVE